MLYTKDIFSHFRRVQRNQRNSPLGFRCSSFLSVGDDKDKWRNFRHLANPPFPYSTIRVSNFQDFVKCQQIYSGSSVHCIFILFFKVKERKSSPIVLKHLLDQDGVLRQRYRSNVAKTTYEKKKRREHEHREGRRERTRPVDSFFVGVFCAVFLAFRVSCV